MKDNNNVKSIWESDCWYQQELDRIWVLYEHEPEIKEVPSWRSWEGGSRQKK